MSWTISAKYKDPDYNNVSLLLHGNGTNGSTTITDNSPSPKTVTAVGNAQISTAQSKFGGASLLFDGTGDRLSIAASPDFSYGAGNFTIEAWVRITSFGNGFAILSHFTGEGATARLGFGLTSSGPFVDTTFGLALTFIGSTSLSTNTWYHCALVRNGSIFTTYIDGVAISTASSSSPYVPASAPLSVGDYADDFPTGAGYIDDLRVTKGIARYTVNFTPPAAPFPDI
jgi:hypothetical protein